MDRSEAEDNVRSPIQTPYMRRDSEYNPEYLDPERALLRFAPLIESVVWQMRSWYDIDNKYEIEDLRSSVQTEFLQLCERFDPSYGLDFPGYIKMSLRRHARYYITRNRKHVGRELLRFGSDITDNYNESVPDEKAASQLERVEYVLSVPIDKIENETYRDIIKCILIDGMDVHALADRHHVTARSMMMRIEAAGAYVRGIMQREAAEKMRDQGLTEDREDVDAENEETENGR